MSAPLGFLGLGRMGAAVAARMLAAGFDLEVWNRSRSDSFDELVAAGASPVDSPREALAAPMSFSMLADDAAADHVLSAANIGAGGARIHVNMASVSAEMTSTLEERFAVAGVRYVAAPVLGRPEVAAAGRLNVLLAGPSESLDRVDPVLAVCSVRRWRMGDVPRHASAAKIAMNFMLLNALESMGEGIALVEGEGIAAADFVELFTSTFFGGIVYETYGGIIAERRYAPAGFSLLLGLKDLGLAEAMARESGVDVASARVLRDRFEAALSDETLADGDWASIAEISRRPSVRD
ncbi:NAD(P)-dependent oxidoreductase [Microbacterium caowuchunii]|uniref:NAD(P)-dependent oxidoreductase n=1 Tax=Microbacterium caowuchunii TaxID=2614638 RepID=UPI001EE8BA4C|nr:NAD(P)-binding domain-containing protein [Microbacterium caowuchunii]